MPRRQAKPCLNQLQAVAIATRFLLREMPDAQFREVWTVLHEGDWLVSFGMIQPPGESSSGGCAVAVNEKNGAAKWFLTL